MHIDNKQNIKQRVLYIDDICAFLTSITYQIMSTQTVYRYLYKNRYNDDP